MSNMTGMNRNIVSESSSIHQDVANASAFPFFDWRLMFYLIHPSEMPETEDVKHIPSYTNQVIPVFILMLLIELAAKYYYTGSGFRINDTITSIGAGLASQTIKFITRSLDIIVYIWIYDNYRLWTIPLRSWTGWILTLLAADLAYYWLHRMNHEVSIFWASHQTHHSSEVSISSRLPAEYNLSTALRQSMIGGIYNWAIYLPMAFFGFTPVAHVVHVQLNLLYQFWIHTAMIKSCGFLEYFLNTPSHHRVHHGRNPYCIDKNYAGALIIWDKMFGTFEPEHPDEEVVYGIISPVSSFNGVWVQTCYYFAAFARLSAFNNVRDKIHSLIMGPGWAPGTKRLGNPEDIPAIQHPVKVYDVQIATWKTVYVVVHFILLILFFNHTAGRFEGWSTAQVWLASVGLMASLGNIGSLLDDKAWVLYGEFVRCLAILFFSRVLDFELSTLTLSLSTWFFALSAGIWWFMLFGRMVMQQTKHSPKVPSKKTSKAH